MIVQKHRSAYFAAGILLLYGLLTIGYAFANPIFEAPDENHHFYTAQAIAHSGKLPIAAENLARQEAAQPPLYYVLLAPFIRLLAPEISLQINPYAQLGQAGGNPNLYVPEPGWQSGETAVILLRSISILLGGITLLLIYQAGRLLWPQRPARALLAMSLVAFLPQFNFLQASISNDSLIICLSSLVIWQVLRLWLAGFSRPRFLLLGLTLGAALLTKTAGVLLLLWVCAVFAWWLWQQKDHGRLAASRDFILLTILPACLMSGWLFWRNWQLYGDMTAANVFIELAGGERPLTLGQLLRQLDTVAQSAIAYFGWLTVPAPPFIYGLWLGIILVSLWGILTAVRQHKNIRWPLVLGLASWVTLLLVGWLQFMLRTPAEQGRLLFPALLPLALALAYGLTQFRWYGLAGLAAFATSFYALFFIIPAAYAPPPILAATNLPATAQLLQTQIGPLELVAIDPLPATAVAGEPLEITLYWRKTGTIKQPPTEVIKVLGHDLELVSSRHTYHGNGLFPATFWPDNQIIVDTISLDLTENMVAPVAARLFVNILDSDETVEVGLVKIVPASWPQADTPVLAELGEGIALTNARIITTTNEIHVQLQWQISQAPQRDLTTFVHLGDPAFPPLAQADGPPRQGSYPASLWAAGEVFTDTYTIPLPADLANGRYPIHIGLYDPATGVRLPLYSDGQRQPNDAYLVAEFTTSTR